MPAALEDSHRGAEENITGKATGCIQYYIINIKHSQVE